MTIAFAGVFGAVVAERVSTRGGFASLAVMLALGLASVVYWKYTDNLAPYAAVQFGGMAGVVALLALTPRGVESLPWWGLIAWYALSKLLEVGDTAIWHASSAVVAGHPLKHLAAAMAGFVVAHALRRPAGIAAASNRRPRPGGGRRREPLTSDEALRARCVVALSLPRRPRGYGPAKGCASASSGRKVDSSASSRTGTPAVDGATSRSPLAVDGRSMPSSTRASR